MMWGARLSSLQSDLNVEPGMHMPRRFDLAGRATSPVTRAHCLCDQARPRYVELVERRIGG